MWQRQGYSRLLINFAKATGIGWLKIVAKLKFRRLITQRNFATEELKRSFKNTKEAEWKNGLEF